MRLFGDEGLQTGTDPKEQQRQLRKKQKNRVSAQRSRQKHTNKADALHQQYESLEKHNQALRKEIQGLQSELEWWKRTVLMHERLCLVDSASCLAPLPPGCWGQAKRPLDPEPQRPHSCQKQPGPFQSPVFSPSAQQKLSPDPQPHGAPGLLLSPLPSLSIGPTVTTAPLALLSPSPVQPALSSASSLLRPSSKLKALLPGSAAQPAPLQPTGLEQLARETLAPSPHTPSPALQLACLQDMDKAAFSAGQQGLGVDLSPHPLLAFPLLSSAQVHF